MDLRLRPTRLREPLREPIRLLRGRRHRRDGLPVRQGFRPAGLSVASAQEGSSWRHSAALSGVQPAKAETTWEASYLHQVKPWLTLEPDVQFVNHPDADAARRAAPVSVAAAEVGSLAGATGCGSADAERGTPGGGAGRPRGARRARRGRATRRAARRASREGAARTQCHGRRLAGHDGRHRPFRHRAPSWAMRHCDTLLILGSTMPWLDFYPTPGQARGLQLDLRAERLGLRYPVELGLLGDTREPCARCCPCCVGRPIAPSWQKRKNACARGMRHWRTSNPTPGCRCVRRRSSVP